MNCALGKDVESYMSAMPPVAPTQKKEKWEFVGDNCFKCSKCGEVYTIDQFNYIIDNKFPKGCPNCGADMSEAEDEM
jgi:rubrerythrin